jgi:tRNA(fMet)-specific endonuclease VapC
VLILDTDHLAALERGLDPGIKLSRRLETTPDEIATTIISAEEQLRGWLAQIHRLNDPHREVRAYERLQRRLEFFAAWNVLPWNERAADRFVQFRRAGIRCGSMDLKIACIALVHDGTLLTGNTVDFSVVPGLKVENWLG